MGRNRHEGQKQLARQINQPRFWKRIPVKRGSFSGFLVGEAGLMDRFIAYARQRGYEITGELEDRETHV